MNYLGSPKTISFLNLFPALVRYYIRGECREGDKCRYSHDSRDVPVSIYLKYIMQLNIVWYRFKGFRVPVAAHHHPKTKHAEYPSIPPPPPTPPPLYWDPTHSRGTQPHLQETGGRSRKALRKQYTTIKKCR